MTPDHPGVPVPIGLAERIRQGDASAEEELVEIFCDKIQLMTLARTRNSEIARELAHDVMIAVLCALRRGQLREPEKLAAFVRGTARNTINDYLRTRARQPIEVELSPASALENVAGDRDDWDKASLVRQALNWLHPTDRRILLLVLVEGLHPREVAHKLGLSPEAVRQRKSRAIKRVVEHLKKASRMAP